LMYDHEPAVDTEHFQVLTLYLQAWISHLPFS
jgi:hypothetical protein